MPICPGLFGPAILRQLAAHQLIGETHCPDNHRVCRAAGMIQLAEEMDGFLVDLFAPMAGLARGGRQLSELPQLGIVVPRRSAAEQAGCRPEVSLLALSGGGLPVGP